MLKNQVMHKVIHIIHMEKHVDELIYIMGIETNVLSDKINCSLQGIFCLKLRKTIEKLQ